MRNIVLIAISILIVACAKPTDQSTSIYDGFDEDLVSYIDSVASEKGKLISIEIDSLLLYDVGILAYASLDDNDTEDIDFFSIVERADADLSDIALDTYADYMSIEPVCKTIFRIKIKNKDEIHDDIVLNTIEGWKRINETNYIQETKYNACMDVLKRKLNL